MKHRSAETGRAVTSKYAKANPLTTVKEGKSKDTLRLDWLSNYQVPLDCLDNGVWWISLDGVDYHAKSPRKVIDLAMKGSK